MNDVTRRRFLQWTGMAAAGALTAGSATVDLTDLLAAPGQKPVLVFVTLYGGNDGLNTVVPASDKRYQDGRPDLAYKPEDVLDLGEGLGLNPGMTALHGLWGAGQLAIVRGVGYPKPDHSHFRSMAIWQTASPETQVTTGWLGRWLDATGLDPLRAISVESTVPPFLAGATTAASTIAPTGMALPGIELPGSALAAYRGLGAAGADDSPFEAAAARSVADMAGVAAAVDAALAPQAAGGSVLAAQLGAVAALVAAGVPTSVYSVSLAGFDTHADERATQQRLLGELDAALSTFAGRVAHATRPVVTVVYSEFGRRVRANASQGTDHGTAGPVFVMGRDVRGGFHGEQPPLTGLDDGDLVFTTDFRDVYASLLEEVLLVDAGVALGSWPGRLPLLR